MRLDTSFFENKDTETLAKDLLGKVLVRKTKEGIIKGIINETEAYREDDEASHSFGGKKTLRNMPMFLAWGHIYVYFTYGMYYCMNIVSEVEGYGSAVLLRSVIPIESIDLMRKNRNWHNKDKKFLCNGPAKLCIAFWVDRRYNGQNIFSATSDIYLEESDFQVPNIQISPRIGIRKGLEKMWRFYF